MKSSYHHWKCELWISFRKLKNFVAWHCWWDRNIYKQHQSCQQCVVEAALAVTSSCFVPLPIFLTAKHRPSSLAPPSWGKATCLHGLAYCLGSLVMGNPNLSLLYFSYIQRQIRFPLLVPMSSPSLRRLASPFHSKAISTCRPIWLLANSSSHTWLHASLFLCKEKQRRPSRGPSQSEADARWSTPSHKEIEFDEIIIPIFRKTPIIPIFRKTATTSEGV